MQREAKAVSVPHYKAEEADRKLCDEADVGSQKTSIKLEPHFLCFLRHLVAWPSLWKADKRPRGAGSFHT